MSSSSSSSSLLATWRAHGARPFARKSSSYDSSDDEFDQEEEENISILLAYRAVKRPKFGGSVFGRQKLWRERIEGHEKLMRSYFNENPIFPESYFRRRFRMSLNLFKHIAAEVTKYDRFFEQRRNAAGELGHSTYQKVTAALRMLAYGIPADLIDDHLAMGESTSILCVKRFVVAIVNVFGSTYLRAPNAQDTARLLEINANRGFPGMLGSIDCMHWSWKNCPAAWHGQFKGYKKDATIVLEAVADQETWIWHAFFGMPGSCNDINVLQRSPLMTRLAMREGPLVEFEANGHKYNYGYFLADGIYPRWQTFVKPIIQPRDMDSEGEMIVQMMVDEQAFNDDDDLREHLSIVVSLQNMLDADAEERKRPRRGDGATHADNFWRQYRMSTSLFMTILHGVREVDPYFKLKHDDVGTAGFSSIQKCTAAMRMLAYEAYADTYDGLPSHE
ncbi:hypothetical protein QYE76_031988 [Lolium multiflorum]|uniref:Uncharacterized protein n=1 Tax=Lolium multiflorum TaxID=4521 RepID=A0AAD8VKQ0_LOLMU|nr:hypothetical protein QYE76_031988 [Lolium multiflorum]